MLRFPFFPLCMLLICASAVMAGHLELTPAQDGYLDAHNPTAAPGLLTVLVVRAEDDTPLMWQMVSLVEFDLSALPPYAVVEQAQLGVVVYSIQWDPAGRVIDCCAVTEPWDEATTCWNTAPSWNEEATDSTIMLGNDVRLEWDVTQDVQDMAAGDLTAYGWALADRAMWYGSYLPMIRFYSKESGSPMPTLVIDYRVAEPGISGIADVGGDQGGQVRLSWTASSLDAPGGDPRVTGYAVFRRQDERKMAAAGEKLAGWDYLLTVPAFGDDAYQTVVPTLCDSTIVEGACWSAFLVRAVTVDPDLTFASLPDSGYSLDNLAPGAPTGLQLSAGTLTWDDPQDADFDYFTVYGSAVPELGVEAVRLGYTTGTGMTVSAAYTYLLVTATDFAGNEGVAGVVESSTAAGDAPTVLHLTGASPNPFNPGTTIRFVLPTARPVDLAIYDTSGRLVREVARNEPCAAGENGLKWNARDTAGRSVPAGVYVYRLRAGAETATGRLVLVK